MPTHHPKQSTHGSSLARKEDLLKKLQEILATLEDAERFASDDAEDVRNISEAAFKIRAVIVRLLSK